MKLRKLSRDVMRLELNGSWLFLLWLLLGRFFGCWGWSNWERSWFRWRGNSNWCLFLLIFWFFFLFWFLFRLLFWLFLFLFFDNDDWVLWETVVWPSPWSWSLDERGVPLWKDSLDNRRSSGDRSSNLNWSWSWGLSDWSSSCRPGPWRSSSHRSSSAISSWSSSGSWSSGSSSGRWSWSRNRPDVGLGWRRTLG
jgi:hypothetical protein